MNNKKIFLLTLFVAFSGIAVALLIIYIGKNQDTEDTKDTTETPIVEEPTVDDSGNLAFETGFANASKALSISNEADALEVRAYFDGKGKWFYELKGNKPTPCHKVEVEALVAESFPEQVSLRVVITPPEGDVFCAQVIEEFAHYGDYAASEGASLSVSKD